MGVSFDAEVALIFKTEEAAEEVYEWLEEVASDKSRHGLRDTHCEGAVGTPIYDITWDDDKVVRFGSAGYGTFDLSTIKMTAASFADFHGWVERIAPCQGDNTWIVMDGDDLSDSSQFEFYGKCIPIEEWDEYPQQSDYQTLDEDEDEVVDDEEAFEEAVDEFRDGLWEKLKEEMDERIESYLEEVK